MPYVVGGLIVIVLLYLAYLAFNYLASQARKKAQAAKVMSKDFIQPDIDYLIDELSKITDEFPYPEFYSHEATVCFKIVNEFSASKKDVVVLCPVKDGFEKAMRMAVEQIQELKKEYFDKTDKD